MLCRLINLYDELTLKFWQHGAEITAVGLFYFQYWLKTSAFINQPITQSFNHWSVGDMLIFTTRNTDQIKRNKKQEIKNSLIYL